MRSDRSELFFIAFIFYIYAADLPLKVALTLTSKHNMHSVCKKKKKDSQCDSCPGFQNVEILRVNCFSMYPVSRKIH